MRYLSFLFPALFATSALLDHAVALRKPADSVLLSSVKTLTLRKDAKTSHRRVSAIPQVRVSHQRIPGGKANPAKHQLKCIGGNARGLYEIDVMRCKNQGADYDDEK